MTPCQGALPQLTAVKGDNVDLAAGPARPYPGGARPRPAPRRPRPGQILVAGAHGGAGASTLASLLDPAWDLGAVAPRRRCPRACPWSWWRAARSSLRGARWQP